MMPDQFIDGNARDKASVRMTIKVLIYLIILVGAKALR